MPDKIYKPSWVKPEHMATLGYVLVSNKRGYLKYESSWKLKALHREGRKHQQLLGDGKRIIYFNCTFGMGERLVFCQIREDGDSRTVYNGVITEASELELILRLVE